MMRILLTEEILLDVLLQRDPVWKNSAQLWKLCETGQLHGYVSALTMYNVFVLLRSRLSPARAEAVLNDLRLIFHTADLTDIDLTETAAIHGMEQRTAAETAIALRIRADYLVTDCTGEYAESSVPFLTPAELLAILSRCDPERDDPQPDTFSQLTLR